MIMGREAIPTERVCEGTLDLPVALTGCYAGPRQDQPDRCPQRDKPTGGGGSEPRVWAGVWGIGSGCC